MRGAIAAGHRVTAETGARVLAAGGNAVDACVAAAFASWVAESTLTGPGGGGFMLVHRARDRGARLLDFFVAVPGRGLPPHERAAMQQVDVDFDRATSQVFHIGAASVGVPGTPAGLEAAYRAYGTKPWPELVAPAVELAREGIELTRPQAYLHAILDLILRHTDEGRRIYERNGERLIAGDRLTMPDLANTLERIAERGVRELYDGEAGRAIAAYVREHGGDLDEHDLAEYRLVWRRPVRARFLGHEFLSNPPPSSGGVLIAYGLRLLDRLGLRPASGSAEEIATLAEVMREQTRARGLGFASGLYRGGLARRLLADEAVEAGTARVRARLAGLAEPVGMPGTTQISVVDARGNAASMTASTGAGSGVIVPGTGVHLNNMLGEYDLVAVSPRPGMRLTSMMAPSMVLRDDLPRLVVGSAGSVRLRGAILQIVNNVVGHGLDVREAIDRPRMHLEEPHVHCEGGCDPAEVDRLEAMGYEVTRWRRRNLYFGGAAAVEVREDGTLAAAGDPRRGGHGVMVEA
ncbi:MAG TPA: gamma-glutamyltransferase [Gaiellaceae bacterium]|jgi:gamma-glutamyltranspeptidase/glutathione hydrolase|nr:gamma-glutamyltransferase [Gaiellaceae bacterium]